MPSHQIDLQDPKSIARLLLALTIESGGTLRIPAATYDGIANGRLLLVDYDKAKNEICIATTSEWGRVMNVVPEAFQWVQPPGVSPREVARTEAERVAARVTVRDEEQAALFEEEMVRKRAVAEAVAEGKSPLKIRNVK